MARCFGGSLDGTSNGFELGLNGEREHVVGAATSSATFVTAVELASGPIREWGGGTRSSTSSGFIMIESTLRTNLFADFSNFDNLCNSDIS